jgi:hypothetical protein
MLCHLRRRAGIPTSRTHVRTTALVDDQESFLAGLRARVAAVVFTVRVVVCAVKPLIVAEAGILQVAGSLLAIGVIAQLRLITPMNPPDGVKLIMDVFPVAGPGITVTGVPETEKPGGVRLMV